MPTSEGVVQLPLDGPGKKLRAQTGGTMPADTYAEVLVLQDPDGALVSPARDGVDATGIAAPTGGSGIRGWLSGIYSKLSGLAVAVGTELRSAPVPVDVENFPAFQSTTERYVDGQVLPDQPGANGVLDFAFASAVDLIWARLDGGSVNGRADPFGGTPTEAQGIILEPGIAVPMTVTKAALKVWAPTGSSVSVHGYRY